MLIINYNFLMFLINYLHVFIVLNLVISINFLIIVRVFVLLRVITLVQLEFVFVLAKRVGVIFLCLVRCGGSIFGCIFGWIVNLLYTKKMCIGKESLIVSLASYFENVKKAYFWLGLNEIIQPFVEDFYLENHISEFQALTSNITSYFNSDLNEEKYFSILPFSLSISNSIQILELTSLTEQAHLFYILEIILRNQKLAVLRYNKSFLVELLLLIDQ